MLQGQSLWRIPSEKNAVDRADRKPPCMPAAAASSAFYVRACIDLVEG